MPLNRRKERETVFKMLFASDFLADEDTGVLYDRFVSEMETEGMAESEYIKRVFFGAREFAPIARELISGAAKGWKTERLSKTTLAILTLALYEMKNCDDIPEKISINEAVELAKTFEGDKAPGFINGVLGTLSSAADKNGEN